MADPVMNMIVLGPSRVGKTSLLATMYKEFAKIGAHFGFNAVGDTSDHLDDAYHKLSEVMNQPCFAVVGDLMPGSKTFAEYRFDVSFNGSKEFQIVFHDYRGGTLMRTSDPEFPLLKDRVASSHVIFNVLDAVALMQVDAIKSDKLNAHTRVCELLQDTLTPGDNYLIVFVLVKCETYVKTASKRKALICRFEERHRAVLNLIDRLNRANHNVAALLIPASTLGCVEFKEIDEEGSFIFERNHKEFAPREVEQPLRYALAFALNHVNANRAWWTRWIDLLTRRRKAFLQALRDFYSQRNSEYATYGNDALLR